jgi:hypothetical protein
MNVNASLTFSEHELVSRVLMGIVALAATGFRIITWWGFNTNFWSCLPEKESNFTAYFEVVQMVFYFYYTN